MYVYVCVCGVEGPREREREREKHSSRMGGTDEGRLVRWAAQTYAERSVVWTMMSQTWYGSMLLAGRRSSK